MRLLFKMDKKDYDKCTHSFVRNSARSIMIKGKKIAMIHSIKYDYYKFRESADEAVSQELDGYEAEEAYMLEYVEPDTAIRKNRHVTQSPYNPMMFEREARVLELLIAEGLFDR